MVFASFYLRKFRFTIYCFIAVICSIWTYSPPYIFQQNEIPKPLVFPPDKKVILLLWNDFFSDKKWSEVFGPDAPFRTVYTNSVGRNLSCLVTTNRAMLSNASAIVFHGRNFDFEDLPKTRTPDQRWIFFLLESPIHSGLTVHDWHRANKLGFNLTMYYTFKSSIRSTQYGTIQGVQYSKEMLNEIEGKIYNFATNFSMKPKDAVWFVSNCNFNVSGRYDVVELLRAAGIEVDQWGMCNFRTPKRELARLGEDAFFSRYRFQLAFENSLCEDYVTEKAYKAMETSERYGVIPLLYGGADYTKILPSHAYIDVRQESAKSFSGLVDLLKKLKQSDQADQVRRYFEWQKGFTAITTDASLRAWRDVCERLWTTTDDPPIENIRTPLGECIYYI